MSASDGTAGSKLRRCRRLLPDRQHGLALHPRAEAHIAAEGQGFAGVAIAYNAGSRSEVHAALAEVEAAGAILLKHAQEAFWGGPGYFADPGNFPWEVAWNPSFPIAEDGSIGLPV